MFHHPLLIVLLTAPLAAACGSGAPPPDGDTAPRRLIARDSAPPTAAEAAGATYTGLDVGTVTLKDGVWEGEATSAGGPPRARVILVRDFALTGDLNGDDAQELVVLLSTSAGGSGTFDYFSVLGRRDGAVATIATGALGDRMQIVDATIANAQLVATVVRAGKDDAMCCPTEKARLTYTLRDAALTRTGDEALGQASLADLGSSEWVLSRFTWDEAAPAEPAVTLQLNDQSFVGRSGCNRYMAPVKAGDAGTIAVGPVGGTRMACPGLAEAVERRFLEALGAVQQYGFVAGQLALSYTKDGAPQTMLFRRIG